MGLCVSYVSSSSPSKMTNNRSNGADFWSTIETRNSNVRRPNQFLGAGSDGSGQILESTNVKLYSFLDLKTATMKFKPDLMIGQGGFGEVYRGWIDAKTRAPSIADSGMTVAVRRLNSENLHDFEDWQSVVNFLGRLSHPNLVNLLGHCREGKELLLVYEFMPKGSLSDHLFQRTEPLPWDLRIKIMIGAARSLAFLHASLRTVIYREFNPSNILLGSNYEAKISDLGLAKLGSSQASLRHGSWKHMVMSLLSMWQQVATEMGRITFSCTEPDPKKRPHMKDVLDVLEHIQHINFVIPEPSSTKSVIASSSQSSPRQYQY